VILYIRNKIKEEFSMKKEYFFALTTVFFWGSSAAVNALLLKSLSTMTVLFYTSVIAVVFLACYNLFTGKMSLLKNISAREYLAMSGIGFLGTFMYSGLLYYSMTLMKAQQAFIINYLWPILVVVFSCIILRQKMTLKKGISLILSFFGVAVVATEGNLLSLGGINVVGTAACILAAVCYGLYSVLTIKVTCDKFVAILIYYAVCSVVSGAALLLTGGIPPLTTGQLPGILWDGVLVYGVAYTTWALALDLGDTAKMSNLAYLTPFVSLIWIYFLTGEPIHWSSYVGLAFILLGVALQIFKSKNDPAEKDPAAPQDAA